MSGDPTYRIFDELSSYRFSVTQNQVAWRFFENVLFQFDMICLDVRSSCTSVQNSERDGDCPSVAWHHDAARRAQWRAP